MQQKKLFQAIRKQLPHRYSKFISENSTGISVSQVQLIFKGEITDPEKVNKVMAAAIKLQRIHQENKQIRRSKKSK